jgi:hypothetical protein
MCEGCIFGDSGYPINSAGPADDRSRRIYGGGWRWNRGGAAQTQRDTRGMTRPGRSHPPGNRTERRLPTQDRASGGAGLQPAGQAQESVSFCLHNPARATLAQAGIQTIDTTGNPRNQAAGSAQSEDVSDDETSRLVKQLLIRHPRQERKTPETNTHRPALRPRNGYRNTAADVQTTKNRATRMYTTLATCITDHQHDNDPEKLTRTDVNAQTRRRGSGHLPTAYNSVDDRSCMKNAPTDENHTWSGFEAPHPTCPLPVSASAAASTDDPDRWKRGGGGGRPGQREGQDIPPTSSGSQHPRPDTLLRFADYYN